MKALVICLLLGSLSFCAVAHGSKENDATPSQYELDDILIENKATEKDPSIMENDSAYGLSDVGKEDGVTKDATQAKSKIVQYGIYLAMLGKSKQTFFRRNVVCYRPFGCFSKERPWNRVYNFIPNPPSQMGTKFILFTRKAPKGQEVPIFKVKASRISGRKRTFFIIHGWQETEKSALWMIAMKNELLKRADVNVFIVYWTQGAAPQYFLAAANSRLVGAQIAYFVERLHKDKRLCYDNVHLIGFSLGGQVVAFAGKQLRKKGHLISRITGLDPAAPLFTHEPKEKRLESGDAKFVDVIHTSYLYYVGIKKRSGHVDFYVNGGGAQPDCTGTHASSCSHFRAVYMFIKSINKGCRYRAYKCPSFVDLCLGLCKNAKTTYLGFDTNRRARGTFYLKTTLVPPYC